MTLVKNLFKWFYMEKYNILEFRNGSFLYVFVGWCTLELMIQTGD